MYKVFTIQSIWIAFVSFPEKKLRILVDWKNPFRFWLRLEIGTEKNFSFLLNVFQTLTKKAKSTLTDLRRRVGTSDVGTTNDRLWN
jgi:hypothetical protein